MVGDTDAATCVFSHDLSRPEDLRLGLGRPRPSAESAVGPAPGGGRRCLRTLPRPPPADEPERRVPLGLLDVAVVSSLNPDVDFSLNTDRLVRALWARGAHPARDLGKPTWQGERGRWEMSAPSFCSARPGHRLCTRWLRQATMTCAGAMMAPSPTGKPPLGEATCLAHGHTAVNAPSLPSPWPQVLRKETLSCVFVAFSVTRPPSCLSRGGGGHPVLTPGPSRSPTCCPVALLRRWPEPQHQLPCSEGIPSNRGSASCFLFHSQGFWGSYSSQQRPSRGATNGGLAAIFSGGPHAGGRSSPSSTPRMFINCPVCSWDKPGRNSHPSPPAWSSPPAVARGSHHALTSALAGDGQRPEASSSHPSPRAGKGPIRGTSPPPPASGLRQELCGLEGP